MSTQAAERPPQDFNGSTPLRTSYLSLSSVSHNHFWPPPFPVRTFTFPRMTDRPVCPSVYCLAFILTCHRSLSPLCPYVSLSRRPPKQRCVSVSTLLIDIRWHNGRQFYLGVKPLLSVIKWTERWSSAIDLAVGGGSSAGPLSVRACGWAKEAAPPRWVRCSGWTDGERRGECMNNEEVSVDFPPLPQLIKDPEYWIWQRGEMSWRAGSIRREEMENKTKA